MATVFTQYQITAGQTVAAISVPGLVAGDVLVALSFDTTTAPHGLGPIMSVGMFEGVVSVNDQIKQLRTSTVNSIVYDAVFARFSADAVSRPLPLTSAKDVTGVPITATPGAGVMGISRTPGASMHLLGEATTVTQVDAVFFEVVLPPTYVDGAALPVIVNQQLNGGGTLTLADCKMTVVGYSESIAGAEAALPTVFGAGPGTTGEMTVSPTNLTFSVSAAPELAPGARVGIGISMTVTNTDGSNTGQINSVKIVA